MKHRIATARRAAGAAALAACAALLVTLPGPASAAEESVTHTIHNDSQDTVTYTIVWWTGESGDERNETTLGLGPNDHFTYLTVPQGFVKKIDVWWKPVDYSGDACNYSVDVTSSTDIRTVQGFSTQGTMQCEAS